MAAFIWNAEQLFWATYMDCIDDGSRLTRICLV